MSFRDNSFGDIKVPLKWAAVAAVVLALAGVIAVMMSDGGEEAAEPGFSEARGVADTAGSAVGGVLAAPGRWVRGAFGGISGRMRDNRDLRRELKALNDIKAERDHYKDLADRYQAVLGLRTDPPMEMITGYSAAESRGPFANSRLINIGEADGVKVGYPVMSENGVIGRVVGVSDRVSRVLMLTDGASQTPVMIDRTNARALLTGDGGPNPRLDYLRTREPPVVGDLVVTSGDGGVFPRGLPVGVVVKGLDRGWRVDLASDAASIDVVRVVKFDSFSQISAADAERLARIARPREMGGAIQTGSPPPAAAPTAGRAATPPAAPTAQPAAPAAQQKAVTPLAAPPTPKATPPAPKTAAPPAATPAPKATPPAPKTTPPATPPPVTAPVTPPVTP